MAVAMHHCCHEAAEVKITWATFTVVGDEHYGTSNDILALVCERNRRWSRTHTQIPALHLTSSTRPKYFSEWWQGTIVLWTSWKKTRIFHGHGIYGLSIKAKQPYPKRQFYLFFSCGFRAGAADHVTRRRMRGRYFYPSFHSGTVYSVTA